MKYLSFDLESTGLEEDAYLIQIAFVPVDAKNKCVLKELGVEYWIQCPSFEELKPKLNSWVRKHNEGIIRKAHEIGLKNEAFVEQLKAYLGSEPIVKFFGKEKIMLLGKSMTALDIPLMYRNLGHAFMREYFHHHAVDVTGVAHSLVDAGILPEGHASGSKLAKFLNVTGPLQHTALADAVDMANIYLELVSRVKQLADREQKPN